MTFDIESVMQLTVKAVPLSMVSNVQVVFVHHSQVLFNSRYPMKLSLFCLGNTAAVVMVGSAGTAVERCHKAEAESTTIRNRPNIFATDFRLPVGNHMG